MSGIVSGLVGGIIAAALTTYVARKVGRSGPPGQLKYGAFMWVLGCACLAFSALPVVVTAMGHDSEFWAKLGLFTGSAGGGVYCLAEAALVRGSFDDDGIQFKTPWTGETRERWRDLVALEFNGWGSWYTLTFRSGAKIRLSRYLGGHISALEIANAYAELK